MQKVEFMTEEELVKYGTLIGEAVVAENDGIAATASGEDIVKAFEIMTEYFYKAGVLYTTCLLYTSPSPRDRQKSRMPSSA